MTAPAPSGDRSTLRSLLPLPLLTAALSALSTLWVVTSVPESAQTLVGCCGAVATALLCVTVAVAVHTRHVGRSIRAALRTATVEAARAAQERDLQAEQWRREHQRHTDATAQERARLAEEFTRERALRAQEFEAERVRLAADVRRLSEQLDRAIADRDTTIAATANAAGRMQALATGTLADLRIMEERHSDEEVLTDLLYLDHRTAQAGRLADSVAVLTGARSGRRWARPISMESVLRGAMGRISGYQRIRLHSVTDIAVAGHAAEGVMHALAEVLDNAANFSPPTAEVHVYVEEVPAGAIISVEDSGLVMSDIQLRRAERAVSDDVGGLGGLTGTRLGLAVVGRLARKHGMRVSFRPSARGGTGVLILIPQEILTAAPSSVQRPAALHARNAPTPAPRVPRATPALVEVTWPADQVSSQEGGTDASLSGDGLPMRRRGRTLAAAETARLAGGSVERRTQVPEDIRTRANRFGVFRQAVRSASTVELAGGHPLPATPDESHDTPSSQTETAHGSPTPSHPEGDTTS
ncbi:ATP-binding protein [Streptomyces asoensis]|uniref:ATP-binding protein n=1 Tax=Streptomyces asoensis TaxID=249586 RepID=UPI0033D9465A